MLILAGGFGKRLQSLVSHVPKPMAPILNLPFLDYLLRYWISQGVDKFVISVGYKAKIIKDYFKFEFNGIKIEYSEEFVPLGTGGAIKKALLEDFWRSDEILIANGDTWFEVDLKKFWLDYFGKNNIAMALKKIEFNDRYGSVLVDDCGKVYKFSNNSNESNFINAGVYLLNRTFFIKYLESYPENFSFERDLLEKLALNKLISSSIQDKNFIDIGMPSDYQKAVSFFSKAQQIK
jgi:D-glycero-alpha-D-manno-heptose 1-phosphate guanylyltransferase